MDACDLAVAILSLCRRCPRHCRRFPRHYSANAFGVTLVLLSPASFCWCLDHCLWLVGGQKYFELRTSLCIAVYKCIQANCFKLRPMQNYQCFALSPACRAMLYEYSYPAGYSIYTYIYIYIYIYILMHICIYSSYVRLYIALPVCLCVCLKI